MRLTLWDVLHDEIDARARWQEAEEKGFFLDWECEECRHKHQPDDEGCPNLEAQRETEKTHGREMVRQARIILGDARRTEKKKRREWSPIYDQLVEAARGVELECKRSQVYAEREAKKNQQKEP